MAVSLIAGLVRTAGSQVAKKGVKRIAVKKTKSLIKDKDKDKVSNKKLINYQKNQNLFHQKKIKLDNVLQYLKGEVKQY